MSDGNEQKRESTMDLVWMVCLTRHEYWDHPTIGIPQIAFEGDIQAETRSHAGNISTAQVLAIVEEYDFESVAMCGGLGWKHGLILPALLLEGENCGPSEDCCISPCIPSRLAEAVKIANPQPVPVVQNDFSVRTEEIEFPELWSDDEWKAIMAAVAELVADGIDDINVAAAELEAKILAIAAQNKG